MGQHNSKDPTLPKIEKLPPEEALRKLQQIQVIADLGTIEATRTIKNELYTSAYFWGFIILGLLVYFIFQYLYIRNKYTYLISQMTKAKSQGSKFNQSTPFFVALALEYPFLYSWKFGNPSFPLALQYAYYSNTLTECMGTGYVNGKDYIQELYNRSQDCGSRMSDSGDCSAMTIICDVFANVDRQDCFKPCPGVPGYSDTYNYISNIGGTAATFGMAGSMLGPIGAAVGAGVGAVFGIFKSSAARKQHRDKCDAIRSNCYLCQGCKFDC